MSERGEKFHEQTRRKGGHVRYQRWCRFNERIHIRRALYKFEQRRGQGKTGIMITARIIPNDPGYQMQQERADMQPTDEIGRRDIFIKSGPDI